MKKNFMILIVAYNAEKTMISLLDKIPTEIWRDAKEIVVSDDASQDKTTAIAEKYKMDKSKKNLTIIYHKKNKGYGGNQKWGYNYAIGKGYDIVVMLHGDVQYNPEYIPSLLDKLKKDNASFVFGSRMALDPLGGGMPFYKFIGNKFLTIIENLVLRKKLSEYHSGYRLYSVDALKKIPFNLCSDGFHFDSEIIIQMCIADMKISELPIQTLYGDEKCYVNVISYGLNILNELVRYVLNKHGLRHYSKYSKSNFNL